ncbi:TipAS antibiotic-recognition domain-containing protein [Dysosmobacter acutus]|uniref:TipAS antibiotic-recognition domain-containing protein n=1 Tax=Dysosmobacter acutus TaxID=2841504 RepID=UPI001F4D3578|nr:TipAS antibiotic-recognition domain-containing protein [Dysosmobacter acutus]
MFGRMPESIRQCSIREFGGVEQWKEHYIAALSSADMQRQYAELVEWYGGKEAYLSAVKNPISTEDAGRCKDQLEKLQQKLSKKRDCGLTSPAVQRLIGAYALVMKTISQAKEEKGLMLAQARFYRDERTRQAVDARYGDGTAEFFARAIEAFYRR